MLGTVFSCFMSIISFNPSNDSRLQATDRMIISRSGNEGWERLNDSPKVLQLLRVAELRL